MRTFCPQRTQAAFEPAAASADSCNWPQVGHVNRIKGMASAETRDRWRRDRLYRAACGRSSTEVGPCVSPPGAGELLPALLGSSGDDDDLVWASPNLLELILGVADSAAGTKMLCGKRVADETSLADRHHLPRKPQNKTVLGKLEDWPSPIPSAPPIDVELASFPPALPPPIPESVEPIPLEVIRTAPDHELFNFDRPASRRRERDDDNRNHDDERPRRSGFRCVYCGTSRPPEVCSKISTAGWVLFVVLLISCFPLCVIGLFIKEDYRVCSSCGIKLG